MTRAALLALLMAWSLTSTADPGDFAYGQALLPVPAAPLQQVSVPDDVYRWVARADLGDLRVYDANSVEIAHALRRPSGRAALSAWQALPLFRLPIATSQVDGVATGDDVAASASKDTTQVSIELADGGAIVAVHGAARVGSVRRYLLDASAYELPIGELKFEWTSEADVVMRVAVETADNLDDWVEVVAGATLAGLKGTVTPKTDSANAQVHVDRVALADPVSAKYLRVTRLDDAAPELESIAVRSRETRTVPRQSEDLRGVPGSEGLEFDTGGAFPVDRFSVVGDHPSYLFDVAVFSRAAHEHPWRARGHHTFVGLLADGVQTDAEPIVIQASQHRYWRVEVQGESVNGELTDSKSVNGEGRLRIEWVPDQLVFAVPGPGSYTLVYGNGDVSGRQWPMRELMRRLKAGQTLDELPRAQVGELFELGGPDKLLATPAPLDWQTVLLWLVLVLGVVGIGGLAVRVLRS